MHDGCPVCLVVKKRTGSTHPQELLLHVRKIQYQQTFSDSKEHCGITSAADGPSHDDGRQLKRDAKRDHNYLP